MLLIIWAKNGNCFQKCTEKPLTAWTKSDEGEHQTRVLFSSGSAGLWPVTSAATLHLDP